MRGRVVRSDLFLLQTTIFINLDVPYAITIDLIMMRFRPNFLILLAFLALFFLSCKTKKVLTDVRELKGKTTITGSLKERYSQILGIEEREIENEKLYKFIDRWMGTPHKAGGIDKNGIDCSGFTSILEQEIYNKQVSRTAKQMAGEVKRKYEEELQEGDLVFFDFAGQKFSHVGVYLHNSKFVHTSTSKGVIVSNLKDPWYYKYFSRAGSVR